MNTHVGIQELEEQGLAFDLRDQRAEADDLARISATARFVGRLAVGHDVSIDVGTLVGANCTIGDGARLENGVIVGDGAIIGDNVHLGAGAIILQRARIGAAAILGRQVIVAPGVFIPDGAQIRSGDVIPVTAAVMTLEPMGEHQRVVTIYGSPDGPRFSSGCQYGDDWKLFRYRIVNAVQTSAESAAHYQQYLTVLRAIGRVVQSYYATNEEAVQAARDQAAALAASRPQQ